VTYRLLAHSTADDPSKYSEPSEVRAWEAREPLIRLRRYLEGRGLVDETRHTRWEAEAEAVVKEAVERAEARMAEMRADAMWEAPYAQLPADLLAQRREWEAGRAAPRAGADDSPAR